MKTNAIRILEAKYIPHERISYASDDEIDAVSVAEKIGVDPGQVFKTLITRGDVSGVIVFCLPGSLELHVKKAASVSGNKSIDMVRMKELPVLTGYIRGGCSPVGMKKLYPTWIDETALLYDRIYVSAGVRGMQIVLAPQALAGLIHAEFADIT